jgi:hypothetical protein
MYSRAVHKTEVESGGADMSWANGPDKARMTEDGE